MCSLKVVPDVLKLLEAPHKAAISLTLDGSSAIDDNLAAKILGKGVTSKFPRVSRLTLCTPGHSTDRGDDPTNQ